MTSLADYVETETQLNDLIAIEQCNGNVRQAAKKLGKNVRTLQRTVERIKKTGSP